MGRRFLNLNCTSTLFEMAPLYLGLQFNLAPHELSSMAVAYSIDVSPYDNRSEIVIGIAVGSARLVLVRDREPGETAG